MRDGIDEFPYLTAEELVHVQKVDFSYMKSPYLLNCLLSSSIRWY